MKVKPFLVATTALLLVTPSGAALALQTNQQKENTRPAPSGNAERQNRPAKPTRPAQTERPNRPAVQPTRPTKPTRPAQTERPNRPAVEPTRPVQRPSRPAVQPTRPVQRSYVPPPTYRPGQARPSTFRRIHRPAYHYPRGWGYRRWRTGLFLPSLFFSNQYYFYDYYALGIGAPPPGYIWVRYGPDLLLIQRRTGRIVDVIYGAFY